MCENSAGVKCGRVRPLLPAPLTPAERSPGARGLHKDGHTLAAELPASPSCASYPVSRRTGPLPAPGPQRPPTGLPRVLLRLCSTRYVWRKHPRLRMIEFNFISLYWPSLPNGIQAAYEDFDRDLIFVFKGNCPRLSSSFSSWWREGQEASVLFSRFKEVSQGESVDVDCVFVERPGLGPLFTTNCCVNFSRLYPLQALISSFTK